MSHADFALVMDGKVEPDLVKPDDPLSIAPPEKEGAVKLESEPVGRKMGLIRMGLGHQALLPTGAAYGFRAPDPEGCVPTGPAFGAAHQMIHWILRGHVR